MKVILCSNSNQTQDERSCFHFSLFLSCRYLFIAVEFRLLPVSILQELHDHIGQQCQEPRAGMARVFFCAIGNILWQDIAYRYSYWIAVSENLIVEELGLHHLAAQQRKKPQTRLVSFWCFQANLLAVHCD